MNYKIYMEVFSALLTPIVALATILLALMQYRRNSLKSRYELYDSRLSVYKGVIELLGAAVSEGNVTPNQIMKFSADTTESRFLFDQGICDYIEEVRKAGWKLHLVNSRLNSTNLSEQKRDEIIEEDKTLLDWFAEQSKVSGKRFKVSKCEIAKIDWGCPVSHLCRPLSELQIGQPTAPSGKAA